jgi:hypothetical protein
MCANARESTAILDSYRCVDHKIARLTFGHDWASCEKADTSYTLVRARSARGFHARGIFLEKSLSKIADVFDPYPTNIPCI